MTLSVKTLRASDGSSLPLAPIDCENIQVVSLAAATEVQVQLTPGLYYLYCKTSDFEWIHGSAAIAKTVRLPGFQSVFMEITLGDAQPLALVSSNAADVLVIPVEMH